MSDATVQCDTRTRSGPLVGLKVVELAGIGPGPVMGGADTDLVTFEEFFQQAVDFRPRLFGARH